MITYGYVRTSTKDQLLGIEAQVQAITEKYPHAVIVVEHASAKDMRGRPVFTALLAKVCAEQGRLVVSKLDRLARNTRDALDITQCIKQCGASLDIMNVGEVTSTVGTLILTVLAAVAEMERAFISERTVAGLAQSKKELGGYRPTRKDGTPRQEAKARKVDPRRRLVTEKLEDGVSITNIVKRHPEISEAFVRRIITERRKAGLFVPPQPPVGRPKAPR